MTGPIRIVVADDHFVVRQGLSLLLIPRNGMQIIGEAASGRAAVELARTLNPDVVLIDMLMPDMDGVEAIAQIVREQPETRVLVLAGTSDTERVSAALGAGALGYVLKSCSPEELLDAIRTIHRGNLILPKELAFEFLQTRSRPPQLNQFTERERAVLQLLAIGKSNREIAHDLSISPTTVRSHVSNILMKLHVVNRTQAALIAREYFE